MSAPAPIPGRGAPEVHAGLTAAERDERGPVWDMSQERAFIETLLNQRFNFFLIIFSLVLAGSVNAKEQLHLQLILTLGAIVTALFSMVLARSQEKLDLILADLFGDPTHPATIINARASQGGQSWHRGVDWIVRKLGGGGKGSRRRLIGVVIPCFCAAVLVVAATLAWVNVLHVAGATSPATAVTITRH